MEAPTDVLGCSVAFVGLGAMGCGMAANLQAGMRRKKMSPLLVWNRTPAKAEQVAAETGAKAVGELTGLASANIVLSCLPSSKEVAAVAGTLGPLLARGSLWIDCTSGEPLATRAIAADLAEAGVAMVDCPVSGGPAGAASGQLTAMVGGDDAAVARATQLIALFAKKKIVRCGGLGCACAVKSVNNALNVSHLVLGAEGLIALAKFGVPPEVALNAINGSSGRSLQTEERLPKEVLSRKFVSAATVGLVCDPCRDADVTDRCCEQGYGFKLGLMLKDVTIALTDVLQPPADGAAAAEAEARGTKRKLEDAGDAEGGVAGGTGIVQSVRRLLTQAVAQEGYDADYSKAVRPLEKQAGVELHAGRASDNYEPPPYQAGATSAL